MKLRILKLLTGLLIVSLSISVASYSKEKQNSKAKSMSDIVEKMNELTVMQKIINNKINLLEKEKKKIQQKKKDIDSYVKQKKNAIDRYVADQQKELDALKKQVASTKIKKLASIYSNAKPRAAADELSKMNEDLAAQILVFMQPRKAGAIISKMNPAKASQIFQKFINKKSNKQ